MITDEQFLDWLESDNHSRAVLVEASCHDGTDVKTVYLSNRPYISYPGDTIANQPYDDVITSVPEYAESIDKDDLIADIEIVNDGNLNPWFDYAWSGHPITMLIGDASWSRDDFRTITSGIIDELSSREQQQLTLSFKDKRAQLYTSVLTQYANNKLIPCALGSVFNAQPILIDAATLHYQCNDHACTISDVRDNGVSVSYTDNADGTFVLSASPVGTITCDITEPNNTVSLMVNYLALKAGLTATEINSAFSNTAPLGLYINSNKRYTDVLNQIMLTVGGYWRFDKSGVLNLLQLKLPSAGSLSINSDQIKPRGIRMTRTETPVSSVSLGYKKNWTVQNRSSLAGSLTETQRDLFSGRYLIVETTNPGINTQYPLADVADVIDSLFVNQVDAHAESDRRALLRSEQRRIYSVETFLAPQILNVGDEITLQDRHYEFTTAKNALVVGISGGVTEHQMTLEIWL